ncbi:MAG: 50S ribosomal protein L6 [Nitrososphaerales archaeon]
MSTKKRAKTKAKEQFTAEIEIPEKVAAKFAKNILEVSGPHGNVKKNFEKIPVNLTIDDKKITVMPYGKRKKDLAITNTCRSIIRNMTAGVLNGYTYKLKIVFAHFPISINIKGKQISIENFFGERSPRVIDIIGDCKVSLEEEDLVIKGPSLEDVSQTAANVELGTKIKDKDQRVFLDGLYIYVREKGM